MYSFILNWSEFLSTLIPIIVWIVKRPTVKFLAPIVFYLWAALILNFLIDESFIGFFETNNLLIYNILSITRVSLFTLFFFNLNIPAHRIIRTALFPIIILLLIAFIIKEPITFFNSNIFSLEAVISIILSILFFFKIMQSDSIQKFGISLLIVTGIFIYESCCFFLFLFYAYLIYADPQFAIKIWNIHNLVYFVFCLYISKGFIEFSKYEMD